MDPIFDLPWVIFSVGPQTYAISTRLVTGIMQIPPVTHVADAPDMFLGVGKVRGEVIPIANMRKILGMSSADKEAEENIKLLAEKKDNLDRWLNELRRCVENGLRFTLSPDPAQYRNFNAFGVGKSIASELKKLEAPYGEMHTYAQNILSLRTAEGLYEEEAKGLLQQMENSANKAVRTIEELAYHFREKLTPMIITLCSPSTGDTCMGFSVDSVRAVDTVELLDKKENSRMLFISGRFCGVAQNEKFPGEILLIDDMELVKLINVYNDTIREKEEEREREKQRAKEEKEKKEKEKREKEGASDKNADKKE